MNIDGVTSSYTGVFKERFRSLIPSYIRDSSVAIVVFDITSLWRGSCSALIANRLDVKIASHLCPHQNG
jgi:GTPase SAR1 family protein